MKYLVLIIMILSSGLYSQSLITRNYTDDSLLSGLEYKFIYTEKKLFIFDTLIYFDNPENIKRFVKEKDITLPANLDAINFTENALALVAYSGVDCHSGFIISFLKDPLNKKFVFDISIMYGGCRAGGLNFTKWALIPKLPKDFTIAAHIHVVYEKDWKQEK